MKNNKLTNKQENILIFIKKHIAKNDYPPTVREIAKEVNLSSPATVHVHLKNLIEKGYIKRNKKNKRIIELLVPNEFEKTEKNEIEIPLIENNKKKSTFKILKNNLLDNNKLIAFKTNTDINILGILKGDILIFSKDNKINNNIVLIKKDNTYYVLSNYNNEDKILGKLIKLYREYN